MRSLSIKNMLLGAAILLLLQQTIIPITAELIYKEIRVTTGINLFLDDMRIKPKDANGQAVDVFVYEGTTYLPIRAMSEALDIPVAWDGTTKSVYLGEHDTGEAAIMLYDMDVVNNEGVVVKKMSGYDRYGDAHRYIIGPTWNDELIASLDYNLDGAYTKLKGNIYLHSDGITYKEDNYVKFYADDHLIYLSPSINTETYVIPFELDLTGVQKLTLEFDGYGPRVSEARFY